MSRSTETLGREQKLAERIIVDLKNVKKEKNSQVLSRVYE